MNARDTMLEVLARDPGDDTAWLALADCLADDGQEPSAELLRLQLALRRRLDSDLWPRWAWRLHELWQAHVEPCQPVLRGPHGLSLVLVPPGSFWMGAQAEERWTDSDEQPRRIVHLSQGYYLGTHPVTQRQWQEIMDFTTVPEHFSERPIARVSHDDALEFCSRLGRLLGRRCRLPSEAEWEYACRASTTTMYCSGDGVEALQQVGWCSYSGDWDSSGGTRPVGQMRPNSWGLYDMHGNVWEWCQDYYDWDYYGQAPAHDPPGPEQGSERVVRGGSWRGGPWFCRSAERRALDGGLREVNVGFRVLVDLG